MQVLVVDDEYLARQRLIKLIESVDPVGSAEGYEVVGEADNGELACEAIERLDPEIVFLDIRMPGMDGLEAAKRITELAYPPAIIFCTAYDEYALQAFESFAVGYLVKPVQKDKLSEVLAKVNRINKAQRTALGTNEREDGASTTPPARKHISIKTHQGVALIPLTDVQCFVADQKYVTVIHADGETLIDDTLKELEGEFSDLFYRIHRNALVAVSEIAGLERKEDGQFAIKLKNSDFMPVVSRRHLAGVRELIATL